MVMGKDFHGLLKMTFHDKPKTERGKALLFRSSLSAYNVIAHSSKPHGALSHYPSLTSITLFIYKHPLYLSFPFAFVFAKQIRIDT